MDYFYEMREQKMEKTQMMENLQRWYLQDKEQSLEAEFEKLLDAWAKQNQQNSQTASK